MVHVEIGDKVEHKDFGRGIVDHLNMSGPVVKFDTYEDVMCIPEYALEVYPRLNKVKGK